MSQLQLEFAAAALKLRGAKNIAAIGDISAIKRLLPDAVFTTGGDQDDDLDALVINAGKSAPNVMRHIRDHLDYLKIGGIVIFIEVGSQNDRPVSVILREQFGFQILSFPVHRDVQVGNLLLTIGTKTDAVIPPNDVALFLN